MYSTRTVALALLVAASACTRVGAPTPEPPTNAPGAISVSRPSALSGMATLGGQRLRVVVHLTTDADGQGTAHLEIPDLPLTADGVAEWRDDGLELELHYGGDCPGDLRVRTERTADGARLEGTLTAKDCTGEESGALVLEAAATGGAPSKTPSALSPGAGAPSLPSRNGRL